MYQDKPKAVLENKVHKFTLDFEKETISQSQILNSFTKNGNNDGKWTSRINQIKPTLGEGRPAFRTSRREQIIIFRLRIGHTRLTYAFILKQGPQKQCLTCQITCTVKHIHIECRAFAVIRKRFFKVTILTELFENVKIDDVLSLRETGLFEKIWRLKTD